MGARRLAGGKSPPHLVLSAYNHLSHYLLCGNMRSPPCDPIRSLSRSD